MSWTPYLGDPREQEGEYDPTVIGTMDKAPLSYGGKRALFPMFSRRPGMNCGQRLQASMAGAEGVMRFTPDQLYFRDSIGTGRLNDRGMRITTAQGEIANKNINMIKRHADGTCDLINLEADGNFYLDLGGQGGRDTRAGQA